MPRNRCCRELFSSREMRICGAESLQKLSPLRSAGLLPDVGTVELSWDSGTWPYTVVLSWSTQFSYIPSLDD